MAKKTEQRVLSDADDKITELTDKELDHVSGGNNGAIQSSHQPKANDYPGFPINRGGAGKQ